MHFALADVADDIRPAAAQALNAIDGGMFVPFSVGAVTLVLATSLTALRSALLPKWLGWAGIPLFVLLWTPVGFFAFALAGIWILIASIVLYRRGVPVGAPQVAPARSAQVSMPS